MALFIAASVSAQVTTSCNPAACKKTAKKVTSGNTLIDLMVTVANAPFSNTEGENKRPACNPAACKKSEIGTTKMVSTTTAASTTYTVNPVSTSTVKTVKCDPALCKKNCAGNPNCSPKDCAKTAGGSSKEATTKL